MRNDLVRVGLALGAASLVACAGSPERYERMRAAAEPAPFAETIDSGLPADAGAGPPASADPDPFRGQAELGREALVRAVLDRNPTLQAARAAWIAAIARHPQATAYEDPVLSTLFGPVSYGRAGLDDAYLFELSQRIPFPGKLRLRGDVALGEAEAAGAEMEALRLDLARAASWLLDDYALAQQSLAVERHHVAVLEELEATARARFEAGQVGLAMPVMADAERAHRIHDRIRFETALRTAAQRINLLLHRPPDAPLPPPPEEIRAPALPALGDAGAALAQALAERPRLRALRSTLGAEDARRELARADYLPDFRVRARQNTFLQPSPLQPAVGLELTLPLPNARRAAALQEAEAGHRATLHRLRAAEADVRFELAQAQERLDEAEHVLRLQRDALVPAARTLVAATRDAFEAGTGDLAPVLEAERGLRQAELDLETARADVSRWRAGLLRALGLAPGLQ